MSGVLCAPLIFLMAFYMATLLWIKIVSEMPGLLSSQARVYVKSKTSDIGMAI